MRKHNWDEIKEMDEYDNPSPGAYIAVITDVEDVEEKEYLRISWDFAEGEYKGSNRETFKRAGFWPTTLVRSYKESALGFFKAFKTALENSNRGYIFDEDRLNLMVGKYIGVILGEEGYINKRGEHKKRLYVAQTRSVEAIQKGDFKVPEYRENDRGGRQAASGGHGFYQPKNSGSFAEEYDDGELPF